MSVAIVTGASQGIGRATAIRLARDFQKIALVARNRNRLEDTAAAVTAAGAEPLVLDPTSPSPPPRRRWSTPRCRPSAGSTPC